MAARLLLDDYRIISGVRLAVADWDLQAAAQAEDVVETWAPNYAGTGIVGLTPDVLRAHLNQWAGSL